MKYLRATAAARPTYCTAKFGNLLSDTWQGQVDRNADGTWNGWLLNHSQGGKGDFRLGFASRSAAARWVNKQLRSTGVNPGPRPTATRRRLMNYFRLQDAGITFNDMIDFNSADGGDGMGDEVGGLCVSGSPDTFGGAEGAYGAGRPGEVVVLKGRKLAEIYDGYRIQPTSEVARFPLDEWKRMVAEGTAWDYEDWS